MFHGIARIPLIHPLNLLYSLDPGSIFLNIFSFVRHLFLIVIGSDEFIILNLGGTELSFRLLKSISVL